MRAGSISIIFRESRQLWAEVEPDDCGPDRLKDNHLAAPGGGAAISAKVGFDGKLGIVIILLVF